MKKKIFVLLIIGLLIAATVAYAASQRALRGPNGARSMLGEYNGETIQIPVDANGYIIAVTS